jgi:hypothetical protein
VALVHLQVMPKSQLAGLMMCTMLVQTVAAPPLSRIAKKSVRMRNRMLLLGLVPMVGANAVFATATSALGAPGHGRLPISFIVRAAAVGGRAAP